MKSAALGIVGVLFGGLISGAAAQDKDVQALLVGRWATVTDPGTPFAQKSVLEMSKEGVFRITGKDVLTGKDFKIEGKYRIVDPGTIEVELPNPKAVTKVDRKQVKIKVSATELTLQSKDGEKVKVTTYQRIKE